MIYFKNSTVKKYPQGILYIFIAIFFIAIITIPSNKTLLAKEENKKPGTSELPPEGWSTNRLKSDQTKLSQEKLDELSHLMALPYAQGVREKPKVKSVTKYDKNTARDGVNFYISGHGHEAFLIDMNGKLLHKWQYGIRDIWPEFAKRKEGTWWRRAYLFGDGSVLAIFDGIGIIKIDKDSRLLWSYGGRAHHGVFVKEDGRIYVLTRRANIVPRVNPNKPILEDEITILSEDGRRLECYSLIECFLNSPYSETIENIDFASGDIFHTNSIQVFDGTQAHLSDLFKRDNVLVSIREKSMLAIVDLSKKSTVWVMNGRSGKVRFKEQHESIMLPNGHFLLFDNKGYKERSKVIEFDPLSEEIVWQYFGSSRKEFYSGGMGASYRLDNGNTFIVESEAGRVFEVTQNKKIVWEFYNSYVAGANNEFIAQVPDMVRVDKKFIKWLDIKEKEEKGEKRSLFNLGS